MTQHFHLTLILRCSFSALHSLPFAGPNACGNTTIACSDDLAYRGVTSSGISGGASVPHFFVCPLDIPTGALPTGFGAWCYNDPQNCTNGPNQCSSVQPCDVNPGICATGEAGASAGETSVFCSSDLPAGAIPNGKRSHSDHSTA